MTVIWTPELKEKAAATRAANKAAKAERLAKKLERELPKPMSPSWLPGEIVEVTDPSNILTIQEPYDWEEAPLHEAQQKAADMKREYERVSAIIVRRQNPANQAWTCFTEEHKHDKDAQGNPIIPASVRKQCLRHGADGRWKFRDDGRFVMENGVRTLKPAFCCNYLCAEVYNRFRTQAKMTGKSY